MTVAVKRAVSIMVTDKDRPDDDEHDRDLGTPSEQNLIAATFGRMKSFSDIVLSRSGTIIQEGEQAKHEFQYVRKSQEPARICFGSSGRRHTSPIGKHTSPFQKRETPENFAKISPNKYDQKYQSALYQLQNKVRSRKGIGFFASDGPRIPPHKIHRVPSPTAYNISPDRTEPKQSKAPFNVSSARQTDYPSKTPGPGRFARIRQCRRTRVDHNFGKPKVVPAVEITCMPKPMHKCEKCHQFCDRDYWKKDDDHYLCHECWREARAFADDEFADVYKEYKKVRNCSFMHSHEGTKAAVRLMPRHSIVSKLRIENYLNLYMSCHSMQ